MKDRRYSLYSGFSDLIRERGIEHAADFAKDCGYTGVEILLLASGDSMIPDEATAREYRQALEKRGIRVACVSCAASLVDESDPKVCDKKTVDRLLKCADFAKAIGSPLLMHTLHFHLCKPKVSYDEIYGAITEGSKIVAEHAGELGLTVIYEPQGMLFNGYEGFIRFIRDMKALCHNTGVCLDVGNTYWVDEEPYDLINEVCRDVKLVHLKDYVIDDVDTGMRALSGKAITEVPIGEGIIDFKRIVSALDTCGFSGYYSIEDVTEAHTAEQLIKIKELLK